MNANYTDNIPDVWRDSAKFFSALGDDHRQRILLTFEKGERLNVSQLVSVSTLSRSAVSHHLKILKDAGILCSRKEGKEVYFWVNSKKLNEALLAILAYVKTME